jgi:histidine triad (HIT) family protein
MEMQQLSSPSCAFCRIVRGEIPAELLHRDETVVAFRDTRPVAPLHILIIPVRHVTSVQELEGQEDGLLDHMAAVARRIAQQENVATRGYRLVINTGGDAGQTVFHLHMHLLAGRKLLWPPG